MSEQNTTASAELNATTELSIKDANKVAAGALIGTALEWYDFFLFSAAAALIFNVQYFTSENATAAAMASFATFGVGLAARPIGGLIFGRMGDKVGRRRVLMITIVGIDQDHTAGFGHPQHVVSQFRVGGAAVGRHDGVEVAAPR